MRKTWGHRWACFGSASLWQRSRYHVETELTAVDIIGLHTTLKHAYTHAQQVRAMTIIICFCSPVQMVLSAFVEVLWGSIGVRFHLLHVSLDCQIILLSLHHLNTLKKRFKYFFVSWPTENKRILLDGLTVWYWLVSNGHFRGLLRTHRTSFYQTSPLQRHCRS